MDIGIEPGVYVVAVSGGVDSIVLLDMLVSKTKLAKGGKPWRLVVAHFDHGMRPDSELDRLFVQKAAEHYHLSFVYDEGKLGQGASEAAARTARYHFLNRVKEVASADAVVTAHHQDDMLETAVINILRGTGRRGLTALKSKPDLLRPLLHMSKQNILDYAKAHDLKWREDSTNQDTRYLRNYVRHKIMPRIVTADREQFLSHISNLAELNQEIDAALADHLNIHPAHDILDRQWFIMLPDNVAAEVMLGWLRQHGVSQLDKKAVKRLLTAAKSLDPGKQVDVDGTHKLLIHRNQLTLVISDNNH